MKVYDPWTSGRGIRPALLGVADDWCYWVKRHTCCGGNEEMMPAGAAGARLSHRMTIVVGLCLGQRSGDEAWHIVRHYLLENVTGSKDILQQSESLT